MAEPSVFYTSPGVYTVTLTASSALGVDVETKVSYIVVDSDPVVDFSINQTGYCLYDSSHVEIQNNTSGAVHYQWNFGDGTSSNDSAPSHYYSAPGNYSITCFATGPGGCVASYTHPMQVAVDATPTADFSVSNSVVCAPSQDFVFSNQSVNASNFIWNFTDFTTVTGFSATKSFASYGQHGAQLIAESVNGCRDTMELNNLLVVEAEEPHITHTSATCVNTPVGFSSGTSSISETWWLNGSVISNSVSPDLTITSSGTHSITVEIVDSNGCVASDTVSIGINPPPTAIINTDYDSVCLGSPILFSDQTINTVQSFWNFSDGNTATDSSLTHVYTQSGDYTVELISTAGNGCSDTMQKSVHISEMVSAFSVDSLAGCTPLMAQFVDNSNGAVYWYWNFGDGNTSSSQNPLHTYTTSGLFDVSLEVSNSLGCRDTSKIYGIIEAEQVVFTNSHVPDTLRGCIPMPVDFSNNIIGSQNWQWDFGDGTTSNLQGPEHVFMTPGVHTVSLVAETNAGCQIVVENYATFIIEDHLAGFMIDSLDCNGLTVTFIDTTSNAVAYHWDFGDGNTSSSPSPTHTYADTNSYTVQLTVQTATGCVSNLTVINALEFETCTANVAQSSIAIPVLMGEDSSSVENNDSTYNLPSCSPKFVQFNCPFDSATSWYWEFGDGTTSTLENPYHIYSSNGVFTATLVAQTPSGPQTQTWPNIVSNQGATASFTADVSYNCDSNLVDFTNTSGTISSWGWTFGNGDSSLDYSPSYSYASGTDIYAAQLTIADTLGCTSTATNFISVLNYAVPFELQDTVCVGTTLYYAPSDTLNYSYSWYYGYGTPDTSVVMNHTFDSIGIYNVQVSGTHALGCMIQNSEQVVVVGAEPYFTINSTPEACVGATFNLNPNDTTADSYYWEIGSSASSTDVYPNITVNQSGTLPIILTVEKHGCISTHTSADSIVIHDVSADFVATQTKFCSDYEFHLTSTDTTSSIWNWSVDGVFLSNQDTAVYEHADSLGVLVQLAVANAFGCVDTANQVITPSQLASNFTISGTSGCAPYQVTFDNQSMSSLAYIWDFGDGTTSTDPTPTHIYSDGGVYTVTLTSLNNGCTDSLVIPNAIEVYQPVADFTMDTVLSCPPVLINFQDSSSSAVSWEWNFGDGGSASGASPSHVYLNSGNYNVSLVITDINGCTDSITSTNPITVPGPIVDFHISDSTGCDSLTIQFTDLSTPAQNWLWFFGDGFSSTDQHPTHTYTAPGTYDVSLQVVDSTGCVTVITKTALINIYETPEAYFTADSLVCSPATLVVDSSIQPADHTVWIVNGDTLSYSSNLSITTAGNYTVELVQSNGDICFSNHVVTGISLIDWFDANVSPIPALCVDDPAVQLVSAQAGGEWWGTGVDSIGVFNPSVSGPGSHVVSYGLNAGCGDTSSITILVHPAVAAHIVQPGPLCEDVGVVSLEALPNSGVWYGSGIDSVTGELNTTTVGVGNHWYSYEVSNGACTATDSVLINIVPRADASFNLPSDVCNDASIIALLPVTSGGNWTGSGLGHTPFPHFDPAAVVPGNYIIGHIIPGTCPDTVHQTITVNLVPQANFSSSFTGACFDSVIAFTNLSVGTGSDNYVWDFGNGTQSTAENPVVSFAPGGTYNVQLTVTTPNGCSNDTTDISHITIADTIPPQVSLQRVTVLDNERVGIEWEMYTGADFSEYELYRTNGITGLDESIFWTSNQTDVSFIDTGLNTLDSTYTYKIVCRDTCGLETAKNVSYAHTTINVEAGAISNKTALVSWSAYQGCSIDTYELYRKNATDTSWTLIATVSGNTYYDSTLYCEDEYYYCVAGTGLCGGSLKSWSDTSGTHLKGIEHLQVSTIKRATVVDDEFVWVEWTEPMLPDAVLNYILKRKTRHGEFNVQYTVSGNSADWLDEAVLVHDSSYVYQVEIDMGCNRPTSVVSVGSSILLRAQKINDNEGVLSWTPYLGWVNGVDQYELQQYTSNYRWETIDFFPADVNTAQVTIQNAITEGVYRVIAYQKYARNTQSTSNTVSLMVTPSLHMPDAFTPDGDRINDLFGPVGINIQDFRMEIYNRWGQLVFLSEDMNTHWDGTYQGKMVQDGVYTYQVSGTDMETFQPLKMNGTVSLIR